MFKKIKNLTDEEMDKLHNKNKDNCNDCPLAILVAGEITCGKELKSRDTFYSKIMLEKIEDNVVNI